MDIGKIEKKEITEEMKESYLDYAMSVIISRALPDVRDGLKPVHRRILYAMHDMGLGSGAKHRKSATVVGETLGKYHPHGDVAVYDALARMAQDFSLRYPLIAGQGNFGSVDGDPPAAMRYTETKMTPLAEELLADIDKETVDFVDNYDGTRKEPAVLPAKAPNLLLNGTLGIAVGMATNIPPHNLSELVGAICYLIDNPKAVIKDLFQFIKGPDFPTGGEIYNQREIIQAYALGKGPIVSRAKTEIVEKPKGGFQIIIKELTYQTNKAVLLEKIAELIKNKKIERVKNIRDESDKEGIRVVLDLKTDAYPQKVLNRLFKYTDLQKTFHLNMLAIVDGIQPQLLSLKFLLSYFIEHRKEVVTRRFRYILKKTKERTHILEGLSKALRNIDKVISTIKQSRTKETAHENLRKKFKLTKIQATAILEMKLQTLAGLERKKIIEELEEKRKLAKEIEATLKSPRKILGVVKKELRGLQEKYGDERRTKVYRTKVGEIKEEELIPKEETIITVTQRGYIKRINPKTYRAQRRGGKGIIGIKTREQDFVEHFFVCSTHDDLLFFTNEGRVFQTKAYEISEAPRTSRGKAIVNILGLSSREKISAVVPLKKSINKGNKNSDIKFLAMITEKGIIKKTKIERFENIRKGGLIAIKVEKDDSLRWVRTTSGQDEILLVTRNGQAIRFSETDLRPMGRAARGVRGIRLKKTPRGSVAEDKVICMGMISPEIKTQDRDLLIVTENGYGKRTALKYYKKQRRGGIGIKTVKITPKNGYIIGSRLISPEEEDLIAISQKGQVIRTPLKNISFQGRVTQGIRIMRLDEGDRAASITCV